MIKRRDRSVSSDCIRSERSIKVKIRVYNPGELAGELARFESGTSSKFHPPSPPRQCSIQSHSPTNLNAHLEVGLGREKERPEHDAAIKLNLARKYRKSSAKITNNIQLLFKIKHSVLTPAHKSQKETQALLLILRSGTLCVVVFNNTDDL